MQQVTFSIDIIYYYSKWQYKRRPVILAKIGHICIKQREVGLM